MVHPIKLAGRILAVVLFTCGCNQSQEEKSDLTDTLVTAPLAANKAPVSASQTQTIAIDKNVLIGTWTRTDAPYRIKISEILNDGNMKVEYFNPKSIRVGKANWVSSEGMLKIYIELRDENYPGSNYSLIYYPQNNLLAGKYYQAVEGVTYDVGFLRAK